MGMHTDYSSLTIVNCRQTCMLVINGNQGNQGNYSN